MSRPCSASLLLYVSLSPHPLALVYSSIRVVAAFPHPLPPHTCPPPYTPLTLLKLLHPQRDFNMDKSRELLLAALAWRDIRQPHKLSALVPEMEFQGRTGKIYVAGWDRWQRPVLIFDNSVRPP